MSDPSKVCVAWGPLDWQIVHTDCPVIADESNKGEMAGGSPGRTGPYPKVCMCDCHTCKRAWWTQGRPLVKDGQIIYATPGNVR